MGNLINEMKGTLSLHLQRAKWEEDQSDIDRIQGGLDALTTASDRFAEELYGNDRAAICYDYPV